jgi:hypothetical protein
LESGELGVDSACFLKTCVRPLINSPKNNRTCILYLLARKETCA